MQAINAIILAYNSCHRLAQVQEIWPSSLPSIDWLKFRRSAHQACHRLAQVQEIWSIKLLKSISGSTTSLALDLQALGRQAGFFVDADAASKSTTSSDALDSEDSEASSAELDGEGGGVGGFALGIRFSFGDPLAFASAFGAPIAFPGPFALGFALGVPFGLEVAFA